jgi:hypothetical protein
LSVGGIHSKLGAIIKALSLVAQVIEHLPKIGWRQPHQCYRSFWGYRRCHKLKGKLRVHDFHEGPSSAHCTVFRDACLKCYMDYNGLCHKWHFFCRIFIEIVHKDSILMFARFAATGAQIYLKDFLHYSVKSSHCFLNLNWKPLEKMRYIYIQPVLYNHCHP